MGNEIYTGRVYTCGVVSSERLDEFSAAVDVWFETYDIDNLLHVDDVLNNYGLFTPDSKSTVSDGFYFNWTGFSSWCELEDVQKVFQPLFNQFPDLTFQIDYHDETWDEEVWKTEFVGPKAESALREWRRNEALRRLELVWNYLDSEMVKKRYKSLHLALTEQL